MGPLEDDDDGAARTAERKRHLDPDDEALLGRKLGDYRVDEVLGEGGMGIVFKGMQPLLKKVVAIKVLKRSLASQPTFVSRLLEEAQAVNAVAHPAIIDAFGFGEAPDGRPYIVMEFLAGEPLDARLATQGRLSAVETLKLVSSLLAPLEAAHAAGIVHRDLKPSNVFLQRLPDGTDFPKLLDFGLARHVDATGRGSGIVGTPSYMAPEQAKEGDITPAADLYALGCIAYEALAGRPPFEGPTAWSVIEKHLSTTPQPLSALVLEVDDEVAEFVDELLAKKPTERPTATAARREVARLLRQREEASTVNDVKTPNRSEARTVLGIEGVDVPLPPPKKSIPPQRGPVPKTVPQDARKTEVGVPVDEAADEPLVLPARPAYVVPLVGTVALVLLILFAWLVFK
jgi:serine/threonine-protein kinase